jgi:uncharacterized protein (UPF0333 family)
MFIKFFVFNFDIVEINFHICLLKKKESRLEIFHVFHFDYKMKRRLKMKKKGQAAMEFLMTYGWAILAAVIAIGVLAYFGVFSPGKYMPEASICNQPFDCSESAAATTGITLMLRNGLGDAVNVGSVAVDGCGTYSTPFTINDSKTQQVDVTCSPALVSGAKFKGDITITYKKSGGTLPQISTGSITKKVA